MPYSMKKVGNRYQVRSPHGIKAKATTKAKAQAQIRLLKLREKK